MNEKFSNSSPLQIENERLRERIREALDNNSVLTCNASEKDSRILILESEISALKVELQEKVIEVQRKDEITEKALVDSFNMSQQVNVLHSNNRNLQDFNDELRQSISNQIANHSLNSSLSREVIHYRSSSCLNESEAFVECDPQYVHTRSGSHVCSRIDDVDETDVSSLVDSSRLNCERDSGTGTLRELQESDVDDYRSEVSRSRTRFPRHYKHPKVRYSRQKNRRFQSRSPNNRHSTPKRWDSLDTRLRHDDHVTSPHHHSMHNLHTPYDITTDSDVTSSRESRGHGGYVSSASSRQTDPVRRKKVIYYPINDETSYLEANARLFRIILCGDSNTGKSSFSLRFCKNEFLSKTRSTLGVDFRLRTIRVEHDRPVTLQIWDTAGQERFRSLSINYFRRADGVVLMYDVTNPKSFLSVRDWMESIQESVPTGIPILLCANKIDLRSQLEQDQDYVTSSEGAQLASNYGVFFIEVSACSGLNVENAMLSLARHLKASPDSKKKDIHDLSIITSPKQTCCN